MTILISVLAAAPARAACTSPAGVEGEMIYNNTVNQMQYCDNVNWIAAGPASAYNPNAVTFGTVGTFLSHDPMSAGASTDTDKFTMSAWFYIPAGNNEGSGTVIYNGNRFNGPVEITLEGGWNTGGSDNLWEFHARFQTAGFVVVKRAFSQNLQEATWYHVLLSFDAAASNTMHLYINDAISEKVTDHVDITGTIDFGTEQTVGELEPIIFADYWIDVGTYIDFSVEANRRKFIDASGRPVDLGADGSLPTGTAPDIFLSGDAANWHVNKGTGGGFTENGTLTDGAFAAPGRCATLGDAYYLDAATGKCYYREDTGANFDNAQLACRANGGHLIAINNAAEETIADILAIDGIETRFGGRDSDDAGTWRWVRADGGYDAQFWSGSTGGTAIPGVFTAWTSGQPNNAGQDCLTSGTTDPYTGWVDAACGNAWPYICEIDAACTAPFGAEGEMIFNADHRVMQYCDGASWVAMGAPKYTPYAVTFDGTNDYLTRGANYSGVVDGTRWTASAWFRRNGGLGTQQRMIAGNNFRYSFRFEVTNELAISASSTGATLLEVLLPPITDTNWHHLMFSFDMADVNKRHVYLDGVDQGTGIYSTYTSGNIDFSLTDHAVGAYVDGTDKLNGDLADVWIDFGTYIDLSVAANRKKFYDAGPVHLGTDGSLPTGATPELFFTGATANWHVNLGTGDGMTENGALTDAATKPGGPPNNLAVDCTGLGAEHYNDGASGHCYYRVDQSLISFDDSQASCNASGGYLAVITSTTENDNIYNNLVNGHGINFIGGQTNGNGSSTWFWKGGGYDDIAFWSGGSGGAAQNGLYNKWTAGEPNDATTPACAQMGWAANGEWDDFTCSGHAARNGFICEKSAVPGCNNPDGPIGSMIYNDAFNVLQYCDGENWAGVGK